MCLKALTLYREQKQTKYTNNGKVKSLCFDIESRLILVFTVTYILTTFLCVKIIND